MKIVPIMKNILKEEKISPTSLSLLIADLFKKSLSNDKYYGINIKISLENFFNFTDKFITEKNHFIFNVSKGDVFTELEKQSLPLVTLNTGFYEKEAFYTTNIDLKHYNNTLVQYMAEIATYCYKEKVKKIKIDPDILETKQQVSLFDIYSTIKEKHNYSKNKILKIMFKTLYENDLLKYLEIPTDKMLFSRYNPLELFDSWYISDVFINKKIADILF